MLTMIQKSLLLLIFSHLARSFPSNNQLPNKMNCGTLVGTVPSITPKKSEQHPNKKRFLWILSENTNYRNSDRASLLRKMLKNVNETYQQT